MKAKDIIINNCTMAIFDRELPNVCSTKMHLTEEEDITKYLLSQAAKYYGDINAKTSYYTEEDFLGKRLPELKGNFDDFVAYVSDMLYEKMMDRGDVNAGTGIFLAAIIEDQEYFIFFKLDYQSEFISCLDESGHPYWIRNNKILPGASRKLTDYFYINLNERKVWLSDSQRGDEEGENFFASIILKTKTERSQKVLLDEVNKTVLETIDECYDTEEDATLKAQKVMEFKSVMAENATKKGNIHLKEVQETVFADNEKAATVCHEKAQERNIEEKPVYISPKLEKKITRKQKLVTDTGIEILVPVEMLTDESMFEYHQGADGKISILIKDIGHLENR